MASRATHDIVMCVNIIRRLLSSFLYSHTSESIAHYTCMNNECIQCDWAVSTPWANERVVWLIFTIYTVTKYHTNIHEWRQKNEKRSKSYRRKKFFAPSDCQRIFGSFGEHTTSITHAHRKNVVFGVSDNSSKILWTHFINKLNECPGAKIWCGHFMWPNKSSCWILQLTANHITQ